MDSKGSVLGGRYRVTRVLGSGGMATVFLCEDDRLGRSVAVKRLHAHSPQETAQRFVREAKLGASLNHPNLVSVYDTITDEDNVLIVMELVQGENLADALRRGRLEIGRTLSVIHDVAAGLDHAHGHGVVHRDIKPANVLLREDGVTKLVDLGIATAADQTQITRSGIVLGTAAYMAPEQLDGSPTGPATDIYALAVVAYEALSGKRARSGRTPMEIAHQVSTEGPPDLQEVWSQAPPEAAEVLCRGMAKDPANRPQSAGELAHELERALGEVGDTRTTMARSTRAGAAVAGAAAGAGAGAAAGADEAQAAGDGQQTADTHAPPTPTPQQERRPEPERKQPEPKQPERKQPPRPPRREPVRPAPAPSPGGGGNRRPVAAAVAGLLLVVVGVVVLVALLSGGEDRKQAAKSPTKTEQAKKQDTQAKQAPQETTTGEQAAQPQAPTQPAPGATNPAEGARLDSQAFRLIQQGNYAEAVPISRRAVAAFPEDDHSAAHAYALFNLGTALNRSGKPKEAIPYLEQRLRFSSDRREVVQQELDRARKSAG